MHLTYFKLLMLFIIKKRRKFHKIFLSDIWTILLQTKEQKIECKCKFFFFIWLINKALWDASPGFIGRFFTWTIKVFLRSFWGPIYWGWKWLFAQNERHCTFIFLFMGRNKNGNFISFFFFSSRKGAKKKVSNFFFFFFFKEVRV